MKWIRYVEDINTISETKRTKNNKSSLRDELCGTRVSAATCHVRAGREAVKLAKSCKE